MGTDTENYYIPCIAIFENGKGKEIKDMNAKVSDIKKRSLSLHSKYNILNLDNIRNIQVFFVDGLYANIVLSVKPQNVVKKESLVKYECTFPESAGIEKYRNIHKAKRKEKGSSSNCQNNEASA